MGIHDLGLFIIAGLLLNITPGPDTLLIVARASDGGRRAAVAAALGVGAGCLVHTLAAAVGLSALLAASAHAFTVVKWVGAAYLLYLGLKLLRSPSRTALRSAQEVSQSSQSPQVTPQFQAISVQAISVQATNAGSAFMQGLLTNVLNPKVALFFLAFLPQFVDPAAATPAAAFLLLGLIFNVNGTLWNLLGAVTAARLTRLVAGDRWRRAFDRLLGVVFIALAARLALVSTG